MVVSVKDSSMDLYKNHLYSKGPYAKKFLKFLIKQLGEKFLKKLDGKCKYVSYRNKVRH